MSLSFRGWNCNVVFTGKGKQRAVKHKNASSSSSHPIGVPSGISIDSIA